MAGDLISIQVRGSDFVEDTLRAVGPKMALNLTRSTVGAVASEIARDAKANMVFTGGGSRGRMKKGTRTKRRRVRDGIVQSDIFVHRAFWWRFHEFGTVNLGETAMFGRALHKMRPNLRRRFDELLLKKLIAAMKRRAKKQAGT